MEYIIPVLSVLISYVLGRLQSSHQDKKNVQKERYTKFYVPFMEKLYSGYMWERSFSTLSFESRSVFFDLLTNNLELLDSDTLSLYPDFYWCFIEMSEHEGGNPYFPDAESHIDQLFDQLVNCVLTETSKLNRSLRLPPLQKAFAEKRSQFQAKQRRLTPKSN